MNPQYSILREKLFFTEISKKFEISKKITLDVGCGYGFFTDLLNQIGFDAYGLDLDKEVVISAAKNYESKFLIGDSTRLPFSKNTFDMILSRGLSVFYKEIHEDIPYQREHLLDLLKKDGFLIFITSTNLSGKKTTIQNHSFAEVSLFFTKPNLETSSYFFFAQGILFKVFGANAFSPFFTKISILLTKITKRSGYVVCVVKKLK